MKNSANMLDLYWVTDERMTHLVVRLVLDRTADCALSGIISFESWKYLDEDGGNHGLEFFGGK